MELHYTNIFRYLPENVCMRNSTTETMIQYGVCTLEKTVTPLLVVGDRVNVDLNVRNHTIEIRPYCENVSDETLEHFTLYIVDLNTHKVTVATDYAAILTIGREDILDAHHLNEYTLWLSDLDIDLESQK